jgi:hypothetical protein
VNVAGAGEQVVQLARDPWASVAYASPVTRAFGLRKSSAYPPPPRPAAHAGQESLGVCLGATASWTAAVSCRFGWAGGGRESARGQAQSKTSRVFSRLVGSQGQLCSRPNFVHKMPALGMIPVLGLSKS